MTDIERIRELLAKQYNGGTPHIIIERDFNSLRNAIGPLLDRVDRLEADARRYQYLKEKQAYVAIDPHYRELPFHERTGWTIRLVTGDDSSLDNAIDAALRGKGE